MNYANFLEPKTIKIGERNFTISKIPALQAQELYTKIMRETDGFGNLGFTMLSRDTVLSITSYVAVETANGEHVVLDLATLLNTHFPNLQDLHDLIFAMLKENFGFLFDGHLQKQLESLDNNSSEA